VALHDAADLVGAGADDAAIVRLDEAAYARAEAQADEEDDAAEDSGHEEGRDDRDHGREASVVRHSMLPEKDFSLGVQGRAPLFLSCTSRDMPLRLAKF